VPCSLVTEHIGRLARLIRRVAIGESICARRCAPAEGGWARGWIESDHVCGEPAAEFALMPRAPLESVAVVGGSPRF